MPPVDSSPRRVSLVRLVLTVLCLALLPCAHAQTAPSIIALSSARQLVSSGGSLSLTVSASGTAPFSYQWKRNGIPISGATASGFTVINAGAVRDNGYYQAVVTNASGTVTSSAIFVAVAYSSPQVLAWGSNDSGQVTLPTGLTGVVAIAAGGYHNLALKSDGTVVGWGYNGYGQTTLPSGLSGVVAVAAGYYHSLALKSDGTVVAWGSSGDGQITVPVGLTGVVAISASNYHSLALKSDGTVVGWGNTSSGQNTPPAGLNNAVAISEAGNFSLALKADGTVVGWGSSNYNETTIPTGLNSVTAIAAASSYAYALRSNGTVTGWGYPYSTAYTVPADLANVVAISARSNVTFALKTSGRIVAWGENSYSVVANTPTALGGIVAVSAGNIHGLLLRDTTGDLPPTIVTPPASVAANLGQGVTFSSTVTSGTAPVTYQWAKNGTAITGATNATYYVSEVLADSAGTYQVTVSNSLGSAAAAAGLTINTSPVVGANTGGRYPLTVGQSLTLTLSSDISAGATVQWRRNSRPLAGSTARTLSLTNVTLAQSGYYQAFYDTGSGPVASSAIFVPVVPTASQIVAWGYNSSGESTPPLTPIPIVAVSSRGSANLAVQADGTVIRWGGSNYYYTSTLPVGLSNVVAVSLGYYVALALRADGTVMAWGDSSYGLTTIPAGLTGVVAVAAGESHALALKGDGTVVAWGNSQYGATAVPTGLTDVVAIGAGVGFSTALRADGTLVAWGYNDGGRSTVPSNLSPVAGFATGPAYTLVTKTDGTVSGFGYAYNSSSPGLPSVPAGLTGVIAAVPGDTHGLALKNDGTLVAWGSNSYGQLAVPVGLQKIYGFSAGSNHSVALRDASGDTVPVIVTPPAAISAFTGQTVSFTVTASGGTAALTYQWRKDGVNLAGATGATLRLSQVTPANVGSYDVTVTDQLGLVTSSAAALTVSPTLAVVTNVAGRHIVNAGQALALTALPAIPGPITYQWLRNGLPVAGATSATYSVASVTPAHGGTYRVVASNSVGAAFSGPVFVGVPAPLELRAWGDNYYNQATVPTGLTGVLAVAAGNSHSLALKSDGTVVGWGYNTSGQANVPAGLTNVVAIAAGNSHSMALRGDGTVVTWGSINYTPIGLSGVVAIASSAISGYAAAIKTDGTVVLWDYSSVRAEFPAGLSEVIAVSLGYYDRLALKADGTVVAATGSNTPVPAGLTNVVGISSGYYHNLAVKSDGTVVGWSAYTNSGEGVPPVGLSGVASVIAGTYVSYAVKTDGSVVTWGSNYSGLIPGALALTPAVALSIGGSHGVALRDPSGDAAPVITVPPVAQTVTAGQNVTLSVTATGTPPPSFQWLLNGSVLNGATTATFTVTGVSLAYAGTYTVEVSNSLGTVTSAPVTLIVNPTLNQRGLLTSSAHANAGPFALSGTFTVEGTVAKQMLIRGIGPALAPFGVSDVLADPQLAITTSAGVAVVSNDNWSSATNASQISSVSAQVGAFALSFGSKDAAVLRSFAPGTYHVRLTGAAGAGGVAFLEIYDADATPRTVYLATSAYAGVGSNTFIHAFTVSGAPAGRSYFIRALGPTLNTAGGLADPRLAVFNADGAQLAANDDWAGDSALAALATSVGAMPLAPASKDAALSFIPPSSGTYTLKVTGAGNTSGLVLVEIFEVDAQRAVTTPAAVVASPQPVTTLAGQPATFAAVTIGKPTPTFQWRRNGTPISGATDALYTIASAQASDVADYSVAVTNTGGSAVSAVAPLALVTQTATHGVVGPGYVAGSTVTVTNTLAYSGTATSLGWEVNIPAGWSYAAGGTGEGDVKPSVGAIGTLGWTWTTPPSSPVTFTYVLNVPAGETVPRALTASAIVRVGTTPQTTAATPGTLLVAPSPSVHSADTNQDFYFTLVELTRVIELYNTRIGSARTGAYAVATTTSEDGFVADPARAFGATATLTAYHTADANRDGRLSLFELTRVIELYNTRSGTTRTGAYHVQSGTEDGFAPGL